MAYVPHPDSSIYHRQQGTACSCDLGNWCDGNCGSVDVSFVKPMTKTTIKVGDVVKVHTHPFPNANAPPRTNRWVVTEIVNGGKLVNLCNCDQKNVAWNRQEMWRFAKIQ
jgi:hypothetical protein